MESSLRRFVWRVSASLVAVFCLGQGISAQDDPDPNSPTPVLLSEVGSTRALATFEGRSERVFQPDAQIVLYATGFKLPDGEGANAFRVYVEDADGRKYRFPVNEIRPGARGIYELTVTLTDQIGFWSAPKADGDILIGLTWRGLISNRVRLGLGQTGGRIKDDPGAIPTPTGRELAAKPKAGGPAPEYVGYRWSGDRSRFMQQATFGQTAALDSRIRRVGLRTWLAEQFEAQYPTVSNPYPNNPLKTSNQGSDPLCDGGADDVPVTCVRDTYTMYQPQTWFWREAYHGDAQLRHRVAWALAQIWVTSGSDVQQGRHMVEYHKVLSNNAFGNYRDLMKQMTLHPTMGIYLDMAISTRNNPNENYARELMQLFSIGLFLLNQDGTLKLDQSGAPIPTYDQNGVNNLTKVLTGWTFCSVAAACPNIVSGTVNYIDPMRINNTNNHDVTAKTLLSWPADPAFPPNNTNIPACTGTCTGSDVANIRTYAATSLDQAIDNAFHHPNVGPFVGKLLIQHMVTSDPTPAYVARVAAVFNNNGLGVRGDMKAVIRAILLDPEARGDVKTDPSFGKLREPVQYATNLLRGLNVRSADGTQQTDGFMNRGEYNAMAQVPFLSPTVFNFYPPDYGIPGTTLLGPEFAIMTTGTSIARTNFVNRFVFTAIPVPVSTDAPRGLSVDFTDLQALSAADPTGNQLLDELNRRFLHNTLTTQNRNTILPAITSVAATDTLGRVRQAVYLVATSSQFQVQR